MSRSKSVLVVVSILCLMMVLDRLVDFGKSRIPPYSAGECFNVEKNPLITVKVLDNHLLAGYSDVEVSIIIASEKAKVSFAELRSTQTEKVKCP